MKWCTGGFAAYSPRASASRRIILYSALSVCDTSPLTTLFYTLDQFGSAPQALIELAERDYSLVVLCGDEFPFVQDGTRQNEAFRHRQQVWYEAELSQRNIPFLLVQGPLSARIDQICRYIQGLA